MQRPVRPVKRKKKNKEDFEIGRILQLKSEIRNRKMGAGMKRRVGFLLYLIACIASAQTRGPMELATAPVPAGARRIAYGKDPLQFGELRLPSKRGPQPLAIVIHGGCWV